MINKCFRLGFVGGGINSAVGTTHFVASQMDGLFKVESGFFSRHLDVNVNTANIWNIPSDRLYSDFDSFLFGEKGKIDAVVVLTPTPNHLEIVLQLLRSGFPVICEKALVGSSNDALMIATAQEDVNGFVAVTYNYSGYPMLRELREMVRQGDLGRLTQCHIEMPQEGYARRHRDGQPYVPQQWRLSDLCVPTLALDLGVHVHHIVDFLTGEKPIELVALHTSRGCFHQVVDNAMCIARYTGELDCNIWFTKSALGHRNGLRVRLYGEKASAEWYQMDPEHLTFNDNMGHKIIRDRANVDAMTSQHLRYNRFKSGHPAGFMEAFANLYCDIADALESYAKDGVFSGSEYVYSARHALEGLVVLEAMATSSREKRWVDVKL